MALGGKGVRFSITASDKTRAAFSGVQSNLRKTQGLQRSWNAGLNANRRAVQQFGFQMSDFAIQIAGGQSAMLAFTQQGGQMLQFFGPAGAIAAAFLAVFGSLAIAFTRSGKALSDLTPILGVLSDDFAAIGRGLSVVKELVIDFANVVINNMDRILITVTMLAGFMAARWVAAFIAARVATFTLVGALTALRVALIRTGLGALIVGAGELVYQFTRLVKGAGGFGNAMGLLANVAIEVWDRIKFGVHALQLEMQAAWLNMKADALEAFGVLPKEVVNVVNAMIRSLSGAAAGIATIFKKIPQSIGNAVISVINFVIRQVDKLITSVLSGVNSMIDGLNAIPGVDIGKIVFGGLKGIEAEAANAGETVGGAVMRGMSDAFQLPSLEEVQRRADELRDAAGTASDLAGIFGQGASAPLKTLNDLREALNSVDDAGRDIDIRDWFGGNVSEDGSGGKSGSKALDEMAKKAKEVKKVYDDMVSSVKSGMSEMFKSIFDKTKSFSDAAKNALGTIIDKVTDMILDPVWDALAKTITNALIGSPSGGGSLLGGIFSGLFGFEGGGYTGQGSRSGGLDGKGGRLAMVHPRETIVDHTMSGGSTTPQGGQDGTLVIRLADGLTAEMMGEMRGIAIETVDSKTPGIVQRSVAQAGKVSQETKKFAGL